MKFEPMLDGGGGGLSGGRIKGGVIRQTVLCQADWQTAVGIRGQADG